ncbi:hypothetical protein Pan44_50280 [Caulifigura coniformis]|uniref:SGNH hydrolase-type esterase domain-containing protein n=1 Tax=Caulifigura coniformis TaxID=2527983 RepID=A0A517SLG5_9PLAN|nr:SGNH/GDSL hydrolase family protein [Caulifigura coniformis]QDT56965.1 hypothetical protein Pan44_50280 [Caulifigura coniformis]
MIRHAAQTFKHLVLTVLLIIGGACALEVGLRVRRATKSAAVRSETTDIVSATTTPSRATFLTVAPKLRFTRIEAESGRPFTLRTNSFGLRNPEVDVPRPEGCFRVLCLGDDNTFAGDLPESFAYSRRLADLLQPETSTRVEILNAGCPGGCPTVSALLLRHRLMTLQPDVIVVHIDPSDLVDEEALRRHVERTAEGFPLAAMHPATAGRTNLATQLDDELLLVQTIRDEVKDLWSRGQSGGTTSGANRHADLRVNGTAFDSIRAALEAIQRLAQGQSVEVLVATAASPPAAKRGQRLESVKWPPQELTALCDELQLPLIDATGDVAEVEETSRTRRTGLLSMDAHEVYAEVLAGALLERFRAPAGSAVPPPERVSSQTTHR